MQIRSLDWEDPLEEGMAAHSGILAWRIPWTEEPGGLTVREITQSRTRLKRLSMHVLSTFLGSGCCESTSPCILGVPF